MSDFKFIKTKVFFHIEDLAALSNRLEKEVTLKDLQNFVDNAVASSLSDIVEKYRADKEGEE